MLVIGHRGCGYEPENTLIAFKKAIGLGVEMIELDVRLTKDKRMVVIHDDKVDRTTDGKGKVSGYSFSEIRELDAGKGEQIPTLEEVFSTIKKGQVNIEVKEREAMDKVVKFVAKKKLFGRVIISFRDPGVLKQIKQKYPRIKTALLICQSTTAMGTRWCVLKKKLLMPWIKEKIIKDALQAKVDVLVLNIYLATKKMIDLVHDNKLKVYVWTVNKDFEKYREADGIFSDYPDRI